MTFQNTREFAQQLDAQDELKSYRNEFIFPQHDGKDVIYFTGNSLGLQPKSAKKYIDDVVRICVDNVTFNKVHDDVVFQKSTFKLTPSGSDCRARTA